MPPEKRSPWLAITTHKTDRDDALVSSAPDPRSRRKSASGRTRYNYALISRYTGFDKPTWQLVFHLVLNNDRSLQQFEKYGLKVATIEKMGMAV